MIIMIYSFAFAFYILLSPKEPYSLDGRTINSDSNNPWNLVPTYQQFDNETGNSSNLLIIQSPGNNTNMFTNTGTALFATFMLFTGRNFSISTSQIIQFS